MRILILCTGNSARSQMAEVILRAIDPAAEVHSAGTQPAARVNPLAVEAMREIGVDLSAARPKSVDAFLGQPFDFVITVCDHARETCPVFTGKVGRRLHMGFQDPLTAEDFRRVRDEIRARFAAWRRAEAGAIRPAVAADLQQASALVEACSLPLDGLAGQFGEGYAVAESGGCLLGVLGMERYGACGLMRSLAVAPEYRGTGLGARLVHDRLDWARRRGISAVYLLTTTAADYLARFGFVRIAREEAPAEVRGTHEFAHACPASAVLMRLVL